MGFVVRNELTGLRTKYRNPTYEMVKQLRGNKPQWQYQYLLLRKEGNVSAFLQYFPEYKREFSLFRQHVHLFTTMLYKNYLSCFVRKEKPLSEYPENMRTHMFQLHKKYWEEKQYISKAVVVAFINEMDPPLLMYSLNYCLHENKKQCGMF